MDVKKTMAMSAMDMVIPPMECPDISMSPISIEEEDVAMAMSDEVAVIS